MPLFHREFGYRLLDGSGLEIGAFHQPALLPQRCVVSYCDAVTREEAVKFFPELKLDDLVPVQHIVDLDKDGLSAFTDGSYDFIVINHVIEHVANPIKVVAELFRVVKPQGVVVISAPDKNFTFDKTRDLTSFGHLLEEYRQGISQVTDEHYLDFLRGVHPELVQQGEERLRQAVESVRNRREHAHVWDSATFEAFLHSSFDVLGIQAVKRFESGGWENSFEYFSVWEKEPIKLAGQSVVPIYTKLLAKIRRLLSRSRQLLRPSNG